jgi:hypothetical protein
MGLRDKFVAGAERAAKEAEKAFDKGKAKVGEIQVELQMDGVAKKLGYLVFDFYRGRDIDQEQRQKYLDELTRLEEQMNQARAEAAAKGQSQTEDGQTSATTMGSTGDAFGAGAGPQEAPQQDTNQPATGV